MTAGGAVLVACDLDRTLIYSLHAAVDGATSGGLPDDLRVVEHYQDASLSHMTARAWQLLDEIMTGGCFVPVTTRTPEQYARVDLPRLPALALCANGGILLREGRRDPEWDDWVAELLASSAPLAEVMAVMEDTAAASAAGSGWVRTHRDAAHLFGYLVAQSRAHIDPAWLAGFTATMDGLGYVVSVQGRKVYTVPAGLTKAAAVTRLAEQRAADLGAPVTVLAAGDSLLDGPMLEAADRAVRPAHGELHEAGRTAPHLTVTSASGARGGEEVLVWLLDQLADAGSRRTPQR